MESRQNALNKSWTNGKRRNLYFFGLNSQVHSCQHFLSMLAIIISLFSVVLMVYLYQQLKIKNISFNPAITTVISGNDQGLWVSVAVASQFGGAFFASMLGFFFFKNYVNDVLNLSQTTFEEYFGVIIGEILGSLILTAGFLFQYDDLMDCTSDRFEHSLIISGLYGVGRNLSYVVKSSLNPAIAILVFFECCKDGHWGSILEIMDLCWFYLLLEHLFHQH